MDPIETPIDRLDDPERAPVTGTRRLAVVTGASTGIGYHLAQCCADHGMDLIIAADEPQIEAAAQTLRTEGTTIEAIQADLSTPAGVDKLLAATRGRQVDVLCANAGRGLGRAFLDQAFADIEHVVETNVTGTLYLLHHIGQTMRERAEGRILITGSIAGFMPGTYQAVYNATKAFLDSFSFALRHELRDTRVTVTCLMPGATETEFFDRADMLDTRIAQEKKADPAEVARIGFEAMMRGEGDVITGWQNKLRAAIAMVTPSDVLAEQHRKMAEPMSGDAVPSVENEPRAVEEK
ncbi:Short-chain dehydrogenase [Cupriavidus sp. OV038]|jgi:short-subunit dehydrogenase|uniref:SDR family NAD(P)-dependent oxidoreductase n=1 Tax=unclassified Cupriavidus TaxID=2640874 RepID=UPI0008E8C6A4|nr:MULTISPECIES: SDR family NAD(P)-dependent oxidoreductase [unclassified Cupriavidus]SFC58765.1 Short-chain dehydrogenase [Cupriavidus sp. OV038]SFP44195.1 Short-chain dehydrogenase [Cupriavidus sp. OV096]